MLTIRDMMLSSIDIDILADTDSLKHVTTKCDKCYVGKSTQENPI